MDVPKGTEKASLKRIGKKVLTLCVKILATLERLRGRHFCGESMRDIFFADFLKG